MESYDSMERLLQKMYAQEGLQESDGSSEREPARPTLIDEEWEKFERKHFPQARRFTMASWQRVAAVAVGILFVTGVALAAFYLFSTHRLVSVTHHSQGTQLASTPKAPHSSSIVVFDDVRLDSIVQVVASHYAKQVVWRNDTLRSLRFLLTWDREGTLDDFIALMNNFEGICLCEENDTITIAFLP